MPFPGAFRHTIYWDRYTSGLLPEDCRYHTYIRYIFRQIIFPFFTVISHITGVYVRFGSSTIHLR